MTETTTAQAAADVLQNETVILQLILKRPGSKRKVSVEEIEAGDADKSLLSVAKDIYDSEELAAIMKHDADTRAFLRSISVPSPLLKGGHYCLRTEAVPVVDTYLDEREQESKALVGEFVAAYPQLRHSAAEKLGKLFDARDYPEQDKLERCFSWSVTWLALETPEALKRVRAAMYDRENRKLRKRYEEAAQGVTFMLREQVASLVAHMVDRLSTDAATGKRKRFRGSLVDNFREFVSKFPFRALGDEQLTELVSDAGKLLDGIDPDQLRENDSLRESVATGFSTIKARLDEMTVEGPERAFDFGE